MLSALRARVRRLRSPGNDRGFMLIELMVVTAIIGTVTGISIPIFTTLTGDGYDTAAAADLRTWVTEMEGARSSYGDTFGPDIPALSVVTDPSGGHLQTSQMVGTTPLLPDFGSYVGYVWDDRTEHVFCYSSAQGIVHVVDSGRGLAADQAECVL